MNEQRFVVDLRVPDLETQYESILDQVWRSEKEWKLDDRLELAWRVRLRRPVLRGVRLA